MDFLQTYRLKPLEAIINKPLHKVSPRLQRMLLRLQKYELSLRYVKGKYLYVADSLSRAHSDEPPEEDLDSAELEAAIHVVLQNLPISEPRIIDLQTAANQDDQLKQLKEMINKGWPNKINNVSQTLQNFWKVKEDLYVADQLILKGHCVECLPVGANWC